MKGAGDDILAIDDDEETIEGLLSEFDLLGYSVGIARTIDCAKEKLRNNEYKVLLVDLRMKSSEDSEIAEDGGLELIRCLRKGRLGPKNQMVPYVLISAQAFWVGRLEAKLTVADLERIQHGRIAKFSKGDTLTPLVRKIVATINCKGSAQ